MRKIITVLAFVFLLALQLVSAEILLFQPSSVYAYGDTMKITASVKEAFETSGFIEINLVCLDKVKNIHKEYLAVPGQSAKSIQPVYLPLDSSLLDGLDGSDCRIVATFNSETAETQTFTISRNILVTLLSSNTTVYPGQSVSIRGIAQKDGGSNVNGFVEATIINTDLRAAGEVVDGVFFQNFTFPENIRSGDYLLSIRVYEKGKTGIISNEGRANLAFSVKQQQRKAEVAINMQEIMPGETFSFQPLIYDQAGDMIYDEVSVNIYDSKEHLVFQELMRSGDKKYLNLDTSSVKGEWHIDISSSSVKSQRFFNVLELVKAEFQIINSTLLIKNIGNVPYKKSIKIQIGDKEVVRDISLDVGKDTRIDLSKLIAQDGEYDVVITADNAPISKRVVIDKEGGGGISGAAISSGGAGFFSKYLIVWLFMIIVFGLFIFTMMHRTIQRRYMGYASDNSSKKQDLPQPKVISSKDIFQANVPLERAEHALVSDGRKEDVSLVNIKIKNLPQLGNDESGTLLRIKDMIKSNKGVVYENREFIIGLFSSLSTRSFRNELPAVKLASQLDLILKDHNKRFNKKIDYGIAAHQGALLLKKEGPVLKFTGIQNTLPLGKKLAEMAQQELLLSENMHKKTANEVKAEKDSINGLNAYRISRIAQRDEKFISGFLKRQEQDRMKDIAPRESRF